MGGSSSRESDRAIFVESLNPEQQFHYQDMPRSSKCCGIVHELDEFTPALDKIARSPGISIGCLPFFASSADKKIGLASTGISSNDLSVVSLQPVTNHHSISISSSCILSPMANRMDNGESVQPRWNLRSIGYRGALFNGG